MGGTNAAKAFTYVTVLDMLAFEMRLLEVIP
jgi:hypothetical protein